MGRIIAGFTVLITIGLIGGLGFLLLCLLIAVLAYGTTFLPIIIASTLTIYLSISPFCWLIGRKSPNKVLCSDVSQVNKVYGIPSIITLSLIVLFWLSLIFSLFNPELLNELSNVT